SILDFFSTETGFQNQSREDVTPKRRRTTRSPGVSGTKQHLDDSRRQTETNKRRRLSRRLEQSISLDFTNSVLRPADDTIHQSSGKQIQEHACQTEEYFSDNSE